METIKVLWSKMRGKKRYFLLIVLGMVNYLGPEVGMSPEQIDVTNKFIAVLFGVNFVGDMALPKK
jgi:hypothetical protein